MNKYKNNQDKGAFFAMLLSVIVILLWQEFYINPMLEAERAEQERVIGENQKSDFLHQGLKTKLENEDSDEEDVINPHHTQKRVKIENDYIKGSINLLGARIDDIILKKHIASLEKPEDGNVVLLSNYSKAQNQNLATNIQRHFYQIGWVLAEGSVKTELPNKSTLWQQESEKAHDQSYDINDVKNNTQDFKKIKLWWKNKSGVHFAINIDLSEDYIMKISQNVYNGSNKEIILKPYIAIVKEFDHDEINASSMAIHEGFIGVFSGILNEIKLKDVNRAGKVFESAKGWLGFSDKYWMTSIISQDNFTGRFIETAALNYGKKYQVDALFQAEKLERDDFANQETMLFLGAKNIEIIDHYQKMYNIPLFDRAIDFGSLYFITKPILLFLHMIYDHIGNFGFAIMLLTVIVKLMLLPLAYKGFKGMSRMKDLQPKIVKLKELHKDNPQELQRSIVELYRKERVNPMGGCLPILMQMPIFFALYKVLYVSIEMRHAPFILWIKDLSVKDPSTIFNLFGIIPWDPPSLLMVGVLPLLMSVTMYIQQNMNPQPIDSTQANVMKMIPLVLLFTFASFPSGLVLYWAWSNMLSIMQQYLIKKLFT